MGKRGVLTEKAETRVSKTTRRRLEAAARRVDRSESAIVRRALERYLDELELGGRRSVEEIEAAS